MRPTGLNSLVREFGVSAVLLASLAAGCGGGGGGGSDPAVGARSLYVVDIDLDGLDGVALNVPLQIEFSEYVLPETIRHDTIQVRLGPRYGVEAFGDFKVSGNFVTFYPRLPSKSDLSDAGFRPQSQYRVTVAGHPKVDQVQAYTGRPLIRTFVANFATAATTSPGLFTPDTYKDLPPPAVQFTNPPDILPKAPYTVKGGAMNVPTDTEVQVSFNRVPLLPSTITPTNISLTMIERFDLPVNRVVQGTPVVEQSFEGTLVRFVPAFPLADQARYMLRIENRVTDFTGLYDVADNFHRTNLRSLADSGTDPALTAYALANPEEVDPRVFLIFTTRDEPTKDLALYLNFDGQDLDENGSGGLNKTLSTADFNLPLPPPATGTTGVVMAAFTAAGGSGELGDFKPTASTVLSTNDIRAPNGVFNYKTIDIPAGVTVTLTGTIPGSMLSLKGTMIAGVVGVAGSNGENGSSTTTGNSSGTGLYTPCVLARGGNAGPGGGKGGDNYQGTTFNPPFINPGGNDAPLGGGKGGGGGQTPAGSNYNFGGGGGGGSHQYAGNPGTKGTSTQASWGVGNGGLGGAASGIQPTSVATNEGKDFHLKGLGGGGGAPGANGYYYTYWRYASGGGGGGGGAILLKSAGDITITGQVVSRGGAGGGSANIGPGTAGAGGGGGGGSVAIFANGKLDITGARLDSGGGAGGVGGTYSSSGSGGSGGSGGGGFNQCEDADGVITGESATATVLIPDMYKATFDPTGTAADAPSYFVSTWFNMGVEEPMLQPFVDADFVEQNYPNCTIKYELQMAIQDVSNYGHPLTSSIDPLTQESSDESKASDFETFKDPNLGILDITGVMNGNNYQFYRVRITFTTADGQKRFGTPGSFFPYVDRLRIRVKY